MSWSRRTNRKRPLNRRASFEPLESRRVFAGNVVVAYNPVGTAAVLTGDALDNAVSVSPFGGGIRIQGRLGTTVNGAASLLLPTNYLASLSVNLQNGNDSIAVIDTFMGTFNLQETLGADNVNLDRVRVRGNVTINTQADKDIVKVNGLFQGNVTVNSGVHNDQVTVSGRIGVLLTGPTGQLDDRYVFGGLLGGNKTLTVNTSLGDDRVSLVGLDVDGVALINTGEDNDIFRTQGVRVADLVQVRTLGGADRAFFQTTACPVIFVDMGADNDLVRVDPFTLANVGVFNLDGGLGNDTLDRGGLLAGFPINFEILI
jgi:hypothetical protein